LIGRGLFGWAGRLGDRGYERDGAADVFSIAQPQLDAFGDEWQCGCVGGLIEGLLERFGEDLEVTRENDGGTEAEAFGGDAEGGGRGEICRETEDGGFVLGSDVGEGEEGVGKLGEEGGLGLGGEGAGVFFELGGVG